MKVYMKYILIFEHGQRLFSKKVRENAQTLFLILATFFLTLKSYISTLHVKIRKIVVRNMFLDPSVLAVGQCVSLWIVC